MRLTDRDVVMIHHRYHYLEQSMRAIAAQTRLPFRRVAQALSMTPHKRRNNASAASTARRTNK